MTPEQEIEQIKRDTFDTFKVSPHVWIIEERGAEFIVHSWSGPEHINGSGVGPPSSYPTLRKAAARLLQLLHVGAVAPQTWPESVCIGSINCDPEPPSPEICEHKSVHDGPRVEVRWGTAPTQICDCGAWRTMHHTPGSWQISAFPNGEHQ